MSQSRDTFGMEGWGSYYTLGIVPRHSQLLSNLIYVTLLLRIFQWPLIALRIKTEVHSGLQDCCSPPTVLFTYLIPFVSKITSLHFTDFTSPPFPNKLALKAKLPMWSSCDYLFSLLPAQEHELCDSFLSSVPSTMPGISGHSKNFFGCMNEFLR